MQQHTKSPRIYILTTGCAVNQAYSEIISGLLSEHGYSLTDDPKAADIIIINACAIKKPTEDRMISLIRKYASMKKFLIVAGCLAEVIPDKVQKIAPRASIVGAYNLFRIPEIVSETLRGKAIRLLDKKDFEPLLKPRNLRNQYIGIVPIARGCLGYCTYCIDKKIWGDLKSYPKEKIVAEVKRLIENGVKEIRLSGQDTGPYGWDLGYNLVDLLSEIVEIPGEFRIRIGMMSPDTAAKIIDDLIMLMRETNKIYKYLHLPVQSGSNRILRMMNRKYTVEEFIELVMKIRKKLGDDTTIATDIITGFPGEREEDHEASIALLKRIKPDIVNLSRYGDRPGVPSSKIYPKIHSKILKKRSRELAEVIRQISYERNKPYIGNTYGVLMLEKDNYNVLGRLYNYKVVIAPGSEKFLGRFIPVLIKNTTWKALYGRIIADTN